MVCKTKTKTVLFNSEKNYLIQWLDATLSNQTTSLFQWALELADYEKTFLDQAAQVNSWDRLLMENGEKVGMIVLETLPLTKTFFVIYTYF